MKHQWCGGEHRLLTRQNIHSPPKSSPYPLHPSTSCSKGITLKLMEMQAGFILLGISLSDLKVKLQLSSPHCLRNDSLERDLCILQTLVPFVCHHTLSDSASGRMTSHKQLFNYSDHTCCCIFFSFFFFGCCAFDADQSRRTLLNWFTCWNEPTCFMSILSFPFKTEGCDARMWALWSGPQWARLAQQHGERWLRDNGLSGFSSSVTRVGELLPNVCGR